MFCCLRISAAGLGICRYRTTAASRIWSDYQECNKNSKPRSTIRTHATSMLYISNILALAIVGGVRLSSSDPFIQRSGEDFAQVELFIFIAVCILYTI
ncbi:MAG: hypothetical protein Q9210_003747, partial [Variospora velana]